MAQLNLAQLVLVLGLPVALALHERRVLRLVPLDNAPEPLGRLLGLLREKNEKRELISEMWGKRGATYGEKGVRRRIKKGSFSAKSRSRRRSWYSFCILKNKNQR